MESIDQFGLSDPSQFQEVYHGSCPWQLPMAKLFSDFSVSFLGEVVTCRDHPGRLTSAWMSMSKSFLGMTLNNKTNHEIGEVEVGDLVPNHCHEPFFLFDVSPSFPTFTNVSSSLRSWAITIDSIDLELPSSYMMLSEKLSRLMRKMNTFMETHTCK